MKKKVRSNSGCPVGVLTRRTVRQFRKRQGWTVRQFCELLGYSVPYLKQLECGHAPITEKFAAQFDAVRGRVFDDEITRKVIETRYRLPRRVLILAKPKHCPGCRWHFIPKTPGQIYCGPKCAKLVRSTRGAGRLGRAAGTRGRASRR